MKISAQVPAGSFTDQAEQPLPIHSVGLRAGDVRKQAAKGEEGSCAARSAVCEDAAAKQRQVPVLAAEPCGVSARHSSSP